MTPDLLQHVLSIARHAGQEILRIYELHCRDHAIKIDHKHDASPITEADLLAHAVISRALQEATPALPVVSEEDTRSLAFRLPRGAYWLVDPLDGTKEFLDKSGSFTVNIALIEDGATVAGVIVAPALNRAYWAGAGDGAWADDGAGPYSIRVAETAVGVAPRVLASKSHLDVETQKFIEALGTCSLAQAGSSLKFCRIADGSADIYPRYAPTCEWDIAAGQAILEAAGGRVLTLDGAPMRYGKADVLNPAFVAGNSRCLDIMSRANVSRGELE